MIWELLFAGAIASDICESAMYDCYDEIDDLKDEIEDLKDELKNLRRRKKYLSDNTDDFV